jgi:hypothetical protein
MEKKGLPGLESKKQGDVSATIREVCLAILDISLFLTKDTLYGI